MSFNAILSDALARHSNMLEHHLADFSEADLFVRPVPGANHAAWQLAHLVNFNLLVARVVSPASPLEAPAKLGAATDAGANAIDDPQRFPTRAELLATLRSATQALVTAVAHVSDAELTQPSPPAFQGFAPTVGQLLLMVPLHTSMHVGQIQVIRRRLGKPLLF